MMRRFLVAAAMTAAMLTATGCLPAPKPTVTAVPSTLRPACKQVTTVIGKVTPPTAVRVVTLERQLKAGGTWSEWVWFENEDDTLDPIPDAVVNQKTGAYSLTYLAPGVGQQSTTRLRMHGRYHSTGVDVASASWYVTQPTGC